MSNSRRERFLDYMSLSGITTKKELKIQGKYPHSEQFMGQLLNGSYAFTEKAERELYQACNVARAKRLMNDKSQDTNS